MGAGTGSEQAERHEEPAVETETSLTGNLEVDLDPADVWTLGQLIDAGAVSLPPGVAEELTTGYRILQASGYEPPEGAQTKVELRGSGDASGVELPIQQLDEAADVTARRVVLAEITSAEEDRAEPGATVEPGVDAEPRPSRRDGDEEAPGPPAAGLDAERTQRLTQAIERLADTVEEGDLATVQLEAPDGADATRSRRTTLPVASMTVDWALIGLGLAVATAFVIAAGVLADPVFALLGLALLGFACFQSYPYLAETTEDDSP